MQNDLPCPAYSPFVVRFIFTFSTLKKLVQCVAYEKIMSDFLSKYQPFILLYNPQRSSQQLKIIWTIIFADAMPFRELFRMPDVLNVLNNCERQSEGITCEIFGEVLCPVSVDNVSALQVMGVKTKYVLTVPGSFALNDSPIYYFDLNVEFERLGYEYKDNTENEIYFSVLEFERLVISNDYSLTVKQENFKKRIKSYHQGAYISKGSISDYML